MRDSAPTTTKDRILDAAEQLFAVKGFDATSLRDVTAAAAANLAAVNYHFGSKTALLHAVVHRIIEPVATQMQGNLAQLHAVGRDGNVNALLDAFIGPFFDLFAQEHSPNHAGMRLIVRLVGDPSEEIQQLMAGELRHDDGYFALFQATLPHLAPDELALRLTSIIGVVVFYMLDAMRGPAPETTPAQVQQGRAQIATFLAAGLSAPATPPVPAADMREPAQKAMMES